jgi:hypothetical protein
MRKKTMAFLVILILVLGSATLAAQVRADLGVKVPLYLGLSTADNLFGGDSGINVIKDFLFIFPEATVSYEFPGDTLSGGLGLRFYTLLIESVVWPVGYLELTFDPVVIKLEAGGGIFGFFGLYNNVHTAALLIPDLAVQVKLGETFRLGVGAFTFVGDWNQSTFPVVVYLEALFVVR